MSQPFKTFLAVITTAFLATTSPPESTMRVQTWQQSEFITPGRYEYTDTGDFWSIDGFIPSVDGHALERMPSWTGHIDFVSNFVQPYGALYDAAYRRYLFVGTSEYHEEGDRLGVMLIPAADLSPYGLTTHEDTAPSELGGNHKQNLIYALGKFWWIGSDGDVYYCDNPYGTTISNPYTAEDAIAIIPVRDTIFLVNDSDEIWYYDTTTSAFVIYYDTLLPLNVKHAFHYRENIVLFAQHEDGSHAIYLVDDHPPATLRQLTRLDYETGILVSTASNAKWATAWAIHDDKLFFSPGSYMTTSPPSMGAMNQSDLYPIYAFDGNSIEYVDTIDPPITPKAWGLLRWRHRLLLYFISAGEQYIYAYHKGRFVQILDATYTTSAWSDLYSVGGHLWIPRQDGGTEGWTRLDEYDNPVFTSSWLDMGRPTVQKYLSHLSALVSEAVSNITVKIEYRTESGSWTTAVQTANARHVVANNLAVPFYALQLRITFTDTGNDDLNLESISATYSYGR